MAPIRRWLAGFVGTIAVQVIWTGYDLRQPILWILGAALMGMACTFWDAWKD